MTENQEIIALARKTLRQMSNVPKSYRDLPMSQEALTFVTLPNGKLLKCFGFSHERQIATLTRKHLREVVAVITAHVIVDRATGAVLETRATFVDNEAGISRRPA